MATATIPCHVVVGSRVQDLEGYRGTVRYLGPVAAAKNPSDIWLGIEWDDIARGKHDGSCVDSTGTTVRHFQCPAGSGSFVKPNKLNFGKSFEQALHERYVSLDAPDESPGDIVPDAFVLTSSGVHKNIEFVGEHKIRKRQQLNMLQKITMRSFSVSTAGNFSTFASHLVEIDLQDNLLSSWKEIGCLTSQLPSLTTLLLHGNHLEPFSEEALSSLPMGCLDGLRVLALNGCHLTSWMEICSLKSRLPNLEELYLAANQFSDITESKDTISELFQRVRILDISACNIKSWEDVLVFSSFPSLEELILDGNPIDSVLPCSSGQFSRLRRVSVSSTR